jgi:hypothetical protein
MAPRKKSAARPEFKLRGLSYSDWEDEAALLRLEAGASAGRRRQAIKRAEEMVKNIDEELEAIERVNETLDRIVTARVRSVKALLLALRASLEETIRRLNEDGPPQAAHRKPVTAI